jgi:hypothetical protein
LRTARLAARGVDDEVGLKLVTVRGSNAGDMRNTVDR